CPGWRGVQDPRALAADDASGNDPRFQLGPLSPGIRGAVSGAGASRVTSYAPKIVPTSMPASADLILAPLSMRTRCASMKPPWQWMRMPSGPDDTISPSFLPRTVPKVGAIT